MEDWSFDLSSYTGFVPVDEIAFDEELRILDEQEEVDDLLECYSY